MVSTLSVLICAKAKSENINSKIENIAFLII